MKKIIIIFMEVSNSSNLIDTNLVNLISKERRNRIYNYQSNINFKLGLYSELLVRYYICTNLSISNNQINIQTNKYGKPYISNIPKIQFNISHTENAIAIAFSSLDIGIDIEKSNSPNFIIADRCFTVPEKNYILHHDNPNHAFYEIWTKKEAYIKWLGIGLYKPLNSFNVLDEKLDSDFYMINEKNFIISIYCKQLLAKKPKLIRFNETNLIQEIYSII